MAEQHHLSDQAYAARTWPEMCAPTPVQWLDWFLRLAMDDQLIAAEMICGTQERALRCLVMDHESLEVQLRAAEEVRRHVRRRADRYRRAWLSARRRGVWLLSRRIKEHR